MPEMTIADIRKTLIDQTLGRSGYVMLRPVSTGLREWFLIPQDLAMQALNEIANKFILVKAGLAEFSATEKVVYSIFLSHAIVHDAQPPLPKGEVDIPEIEEVGQKKD